MANVVEVRLSEEQQEGTESVLAQWLKREGDLVQRDEPIAEVSTDKVSLEIAAPVSGRIQKLLKAENEPVEPGQVLALIEEGDAQVVQKQPRAAEQQASSSAMNTRDGALQLSPAVRQALKKYNLDPHSIKGSGRDGRITVEDVEQAAQAQKTDAHDTISRSIPHSPMRRAIANRMVESLLHTAPHVTSVFEVDMTAVLEHRATQRAEFERAGIKLTLTSYILCAASQALRAVPEINSRWHDDRLELFDTHHIGVGVAMEDSRGEAGLVLPVLRHCEERDLRSMSEELQRITEKARAGQLSKEEMQGATFSLSNHGMSGSLLAAPIIIPQPQSAILGIGKLQKRPVVQSGRNGEDELIIRPMCYVTLTIDHRVIDGFKANAFLARFCEVLEGWA